MSPAIRDKVLRALMARGFSADGYPPARTMWLTPDYLDGIELGALFVQMTSRRESIGRSFDEARPDARVSYEEVTLVVEALTEVVDELGAGA